MAAGWTRVTKLSSRDVINVDDERCGPVVYGEEVPPCHHCRRLIGYAPEGQRDSGGGKADSNTRLPRSRTNSVSLEANRFDPMRRLTLRIQNPELRKDYQQSFELPVNIGRASDNGIRLDEADAEASRYHAEIFSQGAQLYLRDRSLNGTRVGGRKVHNETVEIGAGDEIGISDYRITVSVPSQFTLRYTDRLGRPLQTFDLTSRGGVVAAWTGGGFICEAIGSKEEAGRRYGAAPECLYFHLSGETPALSIVSNKAGVDIRVNDQPVRDSGKTLNSRDVIKVSGERFDLVKQGEELLVCGHCGHLVPYVVQGQCGICGQDLTSAHTCLVRL